MKVLNEIPSLKSRGKSRNSTSDPSNFLTPILLPTAKEVARRKYFHRCLPVLEAVGCPGVGYLGGGRGYIPYCPLQE